MSTLLNKILLFSGGGAASPAFDPSSVAGYSRDWNFADATKLYKDTAHTTPVTADADPIGAVLCSAGSGVYLVAAADGNRFTYKTAIQNGLSVGRADGSDDMLSNAAAITADASQTIIFVVRKRGAIGATTQVALSVHADAQFFTRSTSPNATGYNFYANAAVAEVGVGGTPGNWNIIASRFNSTASLDIYVNGGAPTNMNPADSYAASTTLALAAVAGVTPGDFDYGRVLVYSSALSTTNLDTVFAGLGSLWGISVTAVS